MAYDKMELLINSMRGENMSENLNDHYISIDEAAEYLGIKMVTLRNWVKKTNIFRLIKLESYGKSKIRT